ncbi:hypothetical protein NDU88_004476 [Pleurodeles waltl]|uniref:Uncharacterized protein n=1 Tax=Pleurodeles waltl TaxID=8319 RepID=A0AAV7TSJ2_PLEWA|nr:hypothetical protein NDU88_004476 [Pleurodeles waltl]
MRGRGCRAGPGASIRVAGRSALPDPPLTCVRCGAGLAQNRSEERALRRTSPLAVQLGCAGGTYPSVPAMPPKPTHSLTPPTFCCPVYAVYSGFRFLARAGVAGLRANFRDLAMLHLPRSAHPNPIPPGLQPRQGGATARAQKHPASRSKHQTL